LTEDLIIDLRITTIGTVTVQWEMQNSQIGDRNWATILFSNVKLTSHQLQIPRANFLFCPQSTIFTINAIVTNTMNNEKQVRLRTWNFTIERDLSKDLGVYILTP
jgi:hypothetical protein